MGILWVLYLYLMGLGLGSVEWDATGGWSCDKMTSLLRALPRLASLAIAHGWDWCQSGGSQGGVSNRLIRPIRPIRPSWS